MLPLFQRSRGANRTRESLFDRLKDDHFAIRLPDNAHSNWGVFVDLFIPLIVFFISSMIRVLLDGSNRMYFPSDVSTPNAVVVVATGQSVFVVRVVVDFVPF